MRVIYPNLCIFESATSENDGYPGSYVTNKHLHARWEPLSTDANPAIVVRVSGAANAALIDNITAENVTVTVRNAAGETVKSETFDLTQTDSFYGDYLIERVWLDYTEQAANHTITVALSKGSLENPGIGMIFAGITKTPFSEPLWGYGGSSKDSSIIWDLDRNYKDTFPGNKLRTVKVSHNIRADSAQFHALKRKLADIQREPAAWRLHESATPTHEYLFYAHMPADFNWVMPSYRNHTIDYTIEEFI